VAAAEQPRDVDLVRHLVEEDAAALRRVEFLGAARPVEIVRVVPRRDHAETAQFARRDCRAHGADRRIECVGVAGHEVHAGLLHRGDDRVAVGERQRHRLFQDDVLAGGGGETRMFGMKLVRRRDVDRIDRRVVAQPAYVVMRSGVEVAGERFARRRLRLRRGGDAEAWVARRRVHHDGARHAEADDAEADGRGGVIDHAPSPCSTRNPAIVTLDRLHLR
jgi:hypothetical protein